jgi:hypothetical protein
VRKQSICTAAVTQVAAVLACGSLLLTGALSSPGIGAGKPESVEMSRGGFEGWQAVTLRNGAAEVVVMPSIGRVISFRLMGSTGGGQTPFW